MGAERYFIGLFALFCVWVTYLLYFPGVAPGTRVSVSFRPSPRAHVVPSAAVPPAAPVQPATPVQPAAPVQPATPVPPAVPAQPASPVPPSAAGPVRPASPSARPEPASPASVTWMTDHEAAVARSRAEKKLLFMLFTGSDWCIWCMRLEAEILSTPEFRKYAAENLVLMVLDFPRRQGQPPALAAQNARLMSSLGVRGFPSILLYDPQGKQIAQLGYAPGGPTMMIHLIEKARLP